EGQDVAGLPNARIRLTQQATLHALARSDPVRQMARFCVARMVGSAQTTVHAPRCAAACAQRGHLHGLRLRTMKTPVTHRDAPRSLHAARRMRYAFAQAVA